MKQSMSPDHAAAHDVDFGALFDALPTPYLAISPQMTIIAANAAFLQLTQRTRAAVVGQDVFAAFPSNPADPQADGAMLLRASLQRVLDSGRADEMAVHRYDVTDGAVFQRRYWKVVNTPVQDGTGVVRHVLHSATEEDGVQATRAQGLRGVLVNLTESIRDLKTADDIGYAAASILGQALASSRVGYGTIDHATDTLHVVRDWCAAGVDTLAGSTPLRDYGSFIDDLKLDRFMVVEDVDTDARTAPAAAALRARSAAAFVNAPVVEDGVLAAVLYVNDARARAWTPEELMLIREVAARVRTASERLRGVAALRESEAKFRTIADAMPQMVWSTLPDGYHDYYNQQWYHYTGVPEGSTDGDGWNDIFHPDDSARAWTAWRASLATGNIYEIQYRLRHHSGVYRWVLGRALPIRDDAGAISRWMGFNS
jgi:PAS domain S-box-containing protein